MTQLAMAETIFNDFRELDLRPAYLADTDPNAPCWTVGWCATCWGLARIPTMPSANLPPSGAPSRRCMGAKSGRRTGYGCEPSRSWWLEMSAAD